MLAAVLRFGCTRSKLSLLLGLIRLLSSREEQMDEADSATKALGLQEEVEHEEVGSDTESEAEVTTISVMEEPGNIDMGAESLPNSDEAEEAFGGKL